MRRSAIHFVLAYLKFLIRSTNEHGIHSPFVYNLVTRCFYNGQVFPSYVVLEDFRQLLLHDDRVIQQTDMGAGSRVFDHSSRRISDIVRKAASSRARSRLLNRLTQYIGAHQALELGTSLGMGAASIAAGNATKVTTIEGYSDTAAVAGEMFRKTGLAHIDLQIGEFTELISCFPEERKYDLIFIDGNHRRAATLDYFHRLLPHTHNDSLMIIDDIHWSYEMEMAWAEIKSHSSVRVSIDTFWWGMIFFRKEQEKEHFVVRL